MKLVFEISRKGKKVPSLLKWNSTKVVLYLHVVKRFCGSFQPKYIVPIYGEFERLLRCNSTSTQEKRKMRIAYHFLWHVIGMVPEEYFTVGGRKEAAFQAHLNNVTRWRQILFQNSVNLPEHRAVLDDKKSFNERFSEFLYRD